MLRENVIVKTATTDLHGELFVGTDGLPELVVIEQSGQSPHYRPASLPAAWTVRATNGSLDGLLLEAWTAIDYLRTKIACARREAESEAVQSENRDRAQQREIDNRIEQYLTEEADDGHD